MSAQSTGQERLIARWADRPYTSHRKRHIRVEHRIIANWYPGVGADIRHEIRCPRRGHDDWTAAETWEMRSHGVEKVTTSVGRGLP